MILIFWMTREFLLYDITNLNDNQKTRDDLIANNDLPLCKMKEQFIPIL